MTLAERWQAWKDRQPHPEDWTVPGIAQRPKPVTTAPRDVVDEPPQPEDFAPHRDGWGW